MNEGLINCVGNISSTHIYPIYNGVIANICSTSFDNFSYCQFLALSVEQSISASISSLFFLGTPSAIFLTIISIVIYSIYCCIILSIFFYVFIIVISHISIKIFESIPFTFYSPCSISIISIIVFIFAPAFNIIVNPIYPLSMFSMFAGSVYIILDIFCS